MAYSDLTQSTEYLRAVSGSKIDVIFLQDGRENFEPIGRGSGFSWNDDFEQNPVEEYGIPFIDEYADGKHTGTGSLDTFFIPRQNDRMPSVEDFINKSYTVVEVIAEGYPNAGTILNVFLKLKITGIGTSMSARGLKLQSVSFVYSKRLTGQQASDRGMI